MRGLTVRDPWAWAIVHAGKTPENRGKSLGPYRGDVAVHTSRTVDQAALTDPRIAAALAGREHLLSHPGKVVGLGQLVDVHPARPGCCPRWGEPGAVHHVLTDVVPLDTPIEARGALGLWKVDEALQQQIRAAVRRTLAAGLAGVRRG